MPKRKLWSKIVEAHGVQVRVFERTRGGVLYREVRGVDGKADGKDRKSLKHRDKANAVVQAEALCKALAEVRLIGITEGLTLGQLFAAYRQHRVPALRPPRAREATSRIAMFHEAWGRDLNVLDLSQTHVDLYVRKRRSLEIVSPGLRPTEEGKRRRGYRKPRPVRDGGLHGEMSWLSTCFNFARGFKVNGRRLLGENPLQGLEWPKEKNPRRPVANHQRYTRTLEHTDAVDSRGRLRCILALARYTGRRETAICELRASDLLLSRSRVLAALAAEGMDEGLAEHMPHGAIRWSPERDKEGFLFVSPISKAARAALDEYLRRNPRMGDVPLFPAPGKRRKKGDKSPAPAEQPMSRDRAAKWLVRAEGLAELPKLVGGVFHPYRRLWATERKGLADADVAAAGGWKDTRALKISYQHADAASVLGVVEFGA
jgi:hypothetical protein